MQTDAFLFVRQMRLILEHSSDWYGQHNMEGQQMKAALRAGDCSQLDTCSQTRHACLPQALLLDYEAGADEDRGAEGQPQPLGLIRRPEAIS